MISGVIQPYKMDAWVGVKSIDMDIDGGKIPPDNRQVLITRNVSRPGTVPSKVRIK